MTVSEVYFVTFNIILTSLDYYIIEFLEDMIEIIHFFHLLHFYLEEVDPIFTTKADPIFTTKKRSLNIYCIFILLHLQKKSKMLPNHYSHIIPCIGLYQLTHRLFSIFHDADVMITTLTTFTAFNT